MCDNADIETIEEELDANKVYSFPSDIEIVSYKDYKIAVYPKGIMWIVFRNDEELRVFEALRSGNSIEEVLSQFNEDSVMNVLMQIEAKRFEHPYQCSGEDEKLAYIYLTNNCNQRCRHCYMYAGDITINEVNSSKWIKVLDLLKSNGYVGVTFTGGEITVYPGFDELIKHAHRIGLSVTVLSNGLLWTDNLIKELHEYIDEIQISIDGYDDESYFSVRQSHGFDKALASVKEFSKYGTRVSIAVTPLFDGLDRFIERFEPFARELLQDYPDVFIKLNHELITGRTVKPTQEENNQYKAKLKGLVERLYPNFYIEGFVENYANRQLKTNCGFGGLSFAANGDVYWCNRIHELESEYNVFQNEFSDIIALSNQVKKKTAVDNIAPCNKCEIRYICGGGCRLKFKNITVAVKTNGVIQGYCDGKDDIYEKMINSNEYFFEK